MILNQRLKRLEQRERDAFSGDRLEVGPSARAGTREEGRSLRSDEGRWKSQRSEGREQKSEVGEKTEGRGTIAALG